VNVYLWVGLGVAIWFVLFVVAIAFGKAAAKPWPKRVQRFRRHR
jgi:type IV secretory pathway TrbD component